MTSKIKSVALGGMLAAAALVIMCMGGMIPLATYVCPMLCILVQYTVFRLCGKRIAWTWYAAVTLLSLLMGPDKEAVAVFLLLGYYPMLKPVFEKWPVAWLWKLLLFNSAVVLLYTFLLRLFGLENVTDEFVGFGLAGLIALLLLGNVTFLLLDKLLSLAEQKWHKR
ncbi:MAG: hypothetical protein IJO45_05765 [Oscillospiraceae bacterium]|nr:hypothetical protein [Oscillospiraceae bacterium]